ncbi:dTDP-4-dehydrorhamnose reductase [Christiangramia salexigens]|uniref:dTDP-4-dehydrorhamnose reductase n=1 Tax=Christiangramia salexigens TaxID=1913577 RepID=A0A1L3J6P2_9FLAO|nr:dTDP-4-dehydrorhamnose reductase [Christiangramia salexigens]APG60812.1 dTDP-4-dehydrorhamnose reductase [Christiangramia salexigens]
MKTILVTGAGGQLGQCFKKQSGNYKGFKFLFCTSAELDITFKSTIQDFFKNNKVDYCVNCAAYTNVEQAENEKKTAFLVNAEAARNLAEVCKEYDATLFHFSTDYVFNGRADNPYSENEKVNPINVYGASKLRGEEYIENILKNFFVFRTSWLYSEFGHNFFNTILKKANEKAELNITSSQKGTPTNANDLAAYILKIIESGSKAYGIYHYSNRGEATWFDFAKEILNYTQQLDEVVLNKTGFYKTLAERPAYSVLSKEKVDKSFGFEIKSWKESLHRLIDEK